MGSVHVARDITERKRMEEALRDNEQFLTDIFNSIQDGLSILAPDFTIIRVNQLWRNWVMLHRWRGENVTRFIIAAVPPVRSVPPGRPS